MGHRGRHRLAGLPPSEPLKKPPRKRTLRVLKQAGVDPEMALDRPMDQNRRNYVSPRLAVPATMRYRHGTEEDLMAKVPNRIPELVADYFGFSLMPFHKVVLQKLFAGGKHDIMLPTDHGKSTLCNVVFPILSLMNNPNAAHIICCANIQEARRWLTAIENHLENNAELIRDYPWLARPKDSRGRLWSRTQLMVSGRTDRNNANPSVQAMGRGSGDIKGRRGKYIGDDLEGYESWSEVERTRLYDWMMLEALRCIEDPAFQPRPLFANVGTPFDPDSIHFRLAETGEFDVYKQPYKFPSGQLIWPAKREKILAQRRVWDDRQFGIAMMLDPTGGDTELLSMELIKANSDSPSALLPPDKLTLVVLDPASGSTKRRADYAGLAVLRIEWDYRAPLPMVEVLEAYRVKDEAIFQVEESARLARLHKAAVVVELNAMQRTYQELFRHFAPDVKVIGHVTTRKNKTDPKTGVTILKTLIREKRFKMVAPGGWDDRPEGMKTLAREIRDLGTGAHDHIACACWFGIHYVFQRARTRNLPGVVQVRKVFNPYSGVGGGRSLTSVVNLKRFRVG